MRGKTHCSFGDCQPGEKIYITDAKSSFIGQSGVVKATSDTGLLVDFGGFEAEFPWGIEHFQI